MIVALKFLGIAEIAFKAITFTEKVFGWFDFTKNNVWDIVYLLQCLQYSTQTTIWNSFSMADATIMHMADITIES